MHPEPPFVFQLTLEEELARFEELKPRLAHVWDALTTVENQPCTSVIVPSLTLDQEELKKLHGVSFYEERLLFLLIRLRNPRAHVIYITSQPIHPLILDYYLHLLAGVPASHARARLTMLCAYDASPRSLTAKVLERPRLLQRIRNAIHDPSTAYLTVFNATPLERKLAVLLGIPLNGLDPSLTYLGTKSGSRKVFKAAGVTCAAGFEDVKDEGEVIDALAELREQRPAIRRAVIKLNDSFSGEGNAIFRYPEETDRSALYEALTSLQFSVSTETLSHYFQKFRRMEGIVEEMIEAEEKTSPSAQFRTSPRGEVLLISTHDQILGGDSGQVYLGCRFPAEDGYRQEITEAGFRVGKVLAEEGAVSRYGVDFLASRNQPDDPWQVTSLEINLRVVGTTHPFLALRFLTGGELDVTTGHFLSLSGRPKYYLATDNLRSECYRGILPEDLFDIVTLKGLHYSHRTESGVLFHMVGAVSEFGKLGLTAIANSPEEAWQLYEHSLQVLEAECATGRGEVVSPLSRRP